jgi:transcriptional regulator with XRE-family HTH domain
MSTDDAALASQVRAMIDASGLRKSRVAELAGMIPSQLSDLLAGRYQPTIPTLCRVADACGFDVQISFTVQAIPPG